MPQMPPVVAFLLGSDHAFETLGGGFGDDNGTAKFSGQSLKSGCQVYLVTDHGVVHLFAFGPNIAD